MIQMYTSEKTAINRKKIPAVYKKINLTSLSYPNAYGSRVLDYGTGRAAPIIRKFLAEDISLYPYDPYCLSPAVNQKALNSDPHAIVCSGVLNVIKEDDVILDIVARFKSYGVPFFISVGEGDKSGIGNANDKGWSRNQKISEYLKFDPCLKLKNGVITNAPELVLSR